MILDEQMFVGFTARPTLANWRNRQKLRKGSRQGTIILIFEHYQANDHSSAIFEFRTLIFIIKNFTRHQELITSFLRELHFPVLEEETKTLRLVMLFKIINYLVAVSLSEYLPELPSWPEDASCSVSYES